MIINEGTSKMRYVPDGTKLVTNKCECGCHAPTFYRMLHFIPCCDNGYYQEPETKVPPEEKPQSPQPESEP